jgi:hypothetical protein
MLLLPSLLHLPPTVRYHAIKPFSIHVPDSVDLRGDRKIIVCALAALGNPTVVKPKTQL